MSKAQFLYPESRQFLPVDEVCEQIVRALKERNLQVPDITVELKDFATTQRYRYVRKIVGKNFMLWFNRDQGPLEERGFNNPAAVYQITIPYKQLQLNADESGPSLYTYVGNNWEADQEWFFHDSKVNQLLHNKERRSLLYTGSNYTNCHAYNRGRRPSYLLADDDLGRQYSAVNDEPKFYETQAVLQGFADWLKINVLDIIVQHHVA